MFLKVPGIENYANERITNFRQTFLSQHRENFLAETFWWLPVLACARHRLHLHASKNYPGENISKSKKFVESLKTLLCIEKKGRKYIQESAFCFLKHQPKIDGKK